MAEGMLWVGAKLSLQRWFKMGTFPKRSDHHYSWYSVLINHSGEGRRNDDPARIAAAIDLFDRLRSRLSSGFRCSRDRR